jgi:hypothetical protein
VAHQLPSELCAFFHDARIIFYDLTVQRDRAAYPVLGQRIHDAPDANAVAVIATTVVAHIGYARPEFEVEMLDVWHDPDGYACPARPFDLRAINNRRVGEKARLFETRHDLT